jgi:exodeoxyribonuclease V alpha subunit
MGKVCILTAHRQHAIGAEAISRQITEQLIHHGIHPALQRLPNEPLIINANDSETGLRNGTVGILYTDAQGVRWAYFQEGRDISLGMLPDYSPAWAITIHRSQGSEYDDVFVILPSEESPLATRELLYTAITRAKKNVFIAGSLQTIQKAVNSASNRTTLLTQALARATSGTR